MVKIKGNHNYGFYSILATCLALASTACNSLQVKTCCIFLPHSCMLWVDGHGMSCYSSSAVMLLV